MTYAQYGRLNVHVGASARSVIRKARGMLSPLGRSREMRAERRKWVRAILQCHEDERALCRRFRF